MEDTKAGTRRLAAIMFTDMVGFSALTQKDEVLALRLLGEHNDIFREIVPKHEGREVKSTGDGFLIEFPSALHAVQCAIDVQQTIHDRNLIETEENKISVRIGIHVGDIVTKDGDIFGDGVNIAARIEPLADTGGICISAAVAQQVENKIANSVASIGRAELKNIELPMEIHKVFMPWEVGAPVKRVGSTQRPQSTFVWTAVIAALALAAWGIFGPKDEVPLTESQQLVQRAVGLVEDPMANRDSWMTAFDLCQQAVALDSLDGEAYAVGAQISYGMMRRYRNVTPERVELAKSYVGRAKQFAPSSFETGMAVYQQLDEENDSKLMPHILELRERFPGEPRVVEMQAAELVGKLDRRNPDFTEFNELLAIVREMGGEEYRVLNAKAVSMFWDGNLRLSLEATQQSLAIKDSAVAHQFQFSILSTGFGDFEQAGRVLENLPEEIRHEDRVVNSASLLWLWSGQYEKVIENLENWTRPFIEQGGNVTPADYMRGIAYDKLGMDSIAKRSFESALKAVDERLDDASRDRQYLTWKSVLLFKLDRDEEAMEVGRAAKQLWGRTYTLLDMFMGNYDEVIEALHERIVDRGVFGLLQYTEAKYSSYFDPIRDDPRFSEIMAVGEKWLEEEKAK